MKRYGLFIFGLVLVTFAFNIFLLPNNFAAIGTSGLSIIFNKIYGFDTSLFVLIANTILLLVSLLFLGKQETVRSILGSILFPVFMSLTGMMTKYIDTSDMEIIVSAVAGGFLSGVGYGLIFKAGFTTGGTDILDQIVTKYYQVPIGTSIILVDGLIVLAGGFVFGIESLIYSIIILLLISIFSTRKSLGLNEDKVFYIITSKVNVVKKYLLEHYNYGVTIFDTKGGFSKKDKKVIMCSIKTEYYYELKNAVKTIDPHAFVVITDSYDTVYINKEKRRKNKRLHSS